MAKKGRRQAQSEPRCGNGCKAVWQSHHKVQRCYDFIVMLCGCATASRGANGSVLVESGLAD